MNSRHAHVEQRLHSASAKARGERRFRGHLLIAGPRAHYQHGAAPHLDDWLLLHHHHFSVGVIARALNFGDNQISLLRIDPSRQRVRAGAGHLVQDAGNLRRRLAAAKHHFGKSETQVAMVIDVGKSEIAKWQIGQIAQRQVHRGLAVAHGGEELLEMLRIHHHSVARLGARG